MGYTKPCEQIFRTHFTSSIHLSIQRALHSASPAPIVGCSPLLDGRVVIVTGASSGIGREIALCSAEHGAKGLQRSSQPFQSVAFLFRDL